MKKLLDHIYAVGPGALSKVEFWAATIVLAVAILSLGADDAIVIVVNGKSVVQFSPFVFELFRFNSLYISFVALNFFVVPSLLRLEHMLRSVAIILAAFFLTGVAFHEVDFGFIALVLFGFYSGIRYTAIFIWKNSARIQARYKYISPGVLIATVIWLISIFFLIADNAEREFIAIWATFIPLGIIIYTVSFYSLIPSALNRKRPIIAYAFRVTVILLLCAIPFAVFIYWVTADEDAPVVITIANFLFQLAVTAPFSWFFYKRYHKGREEVITLQKELGQSVASFDFLRTQINPHFLFNALNTIYGTAINEKADRTAEGVQRLGDMMRFMLEENMQQWIPLSKEIDYLKNYITLQKLRTDSSPTIRVDTSIEETTEGSIAPMLLIPFVENAFKHGISFRDPSHIRVTLAMKEGKLYFDVYNSKHERSLNDPEIGRNGIGLPNVQQRLELLYPQKHELIIRETATEFFVHLTIQLSLSTTKHESDSRR